MNTGNCAAKLEYQIQRGSAPLPELVLGGSDDCKVQACLITAVSWHERQHRGSKPVGYGAQGSPWGHLMAGAAAGALSRTAVAPLETLRLQAMVG